MSKANYPGDSLTLPIKGRRCVLLLSGGIDSTVTLELLTRNGWTVHALAISYGQKSIELQASLKIALFYKATWTQAHISAADLLKSPLTSERAPKPKTLEEVRTRGGKSEFFVPARNTIMLSLALALCEDRSLNYIFIGSTLEDAVGFPDCRKPFLDSYSKTASLATGSHIEVRAPLIMQRKVDVVRTGAELGAPLGMTVSCYTAENTYQHCGECPACLIRREAYVAAEIKDPTWYK